MYELLNVASWRRHDPPEAYPGFQRIFFCYRYWFCVNAASVSIRKKYPLEPRVPEAWFFIGDTNILFQKDRPGILSTFPFHAMSGGGRNSKGRYDGVRKSWAPNIRGSQRQFSENICAEDDLRSRIFGTICCKVSWLPASPRIFDHLNNGIIVLKRSPRIFRSLFPS